MIFFLFLKLFFQVSFHNLIPIYINICAYDLFSFAFVKEKSVEYELIDMWWFRPLCEGLSQWFFSLTICLANHFCFVLGDIYFSMVFYNGNEIE